MKKQSRRSVLTPFITRRDAISLHNGEFPVAEWLPIGRIALLRNV